MATINFAKREITVKIVYFGASGAGCSTNVRALFERLKRAEKSKLHRFGPGDTEERSWYFDYVNIGETRHNGFQIRYRIYSLPGGLELEAHRHEVMRMCDAVVFVADARPVHEQANMEALLQLEKMLSELGLELSAVPIVLQVNHVDREEARTPADVVFDLNPYGFPVVSAVAKEGQGVEETHDEAVAAVSARIRDNLAGNEAAITLTAVHRTVAETAEDVIRGHIEAIQVQSASTPQSSVDGVAPAPVDYEELPLGAEVEIAFQPREFVGTHPVRVLHTEVYPDGMRVDVVMERMGGGEPRRLSLLLANRPTDTPAVPRHVPVATSRPDETLAALLPDSVEFPLEPVDESNIGGFVYGIVGVIGGVVIGFLLAYLFGMM